MNKQYFLKGIVEGTLWETNIAMENGPFIDDFRYPFPIGWLMKIEGLGYGCFALFCNRFHDDRWYTSHRPKPIFTKRTWLLFFKGIVAGDVQEHVLRWSKYGH